MLMTALLSSAVAPPVAKKIAKELTIHSDTRVDPYYWLRDKSNPEVIRYLEGENQYTESVMKDTEPLQQRLYGEMLGRIKQTDLSVPVKLDSYLYYSRTEEGKQYPILCRKKASAGAQEEVTLDLNELAKGHKYFRIGAYKVSPDHRLLAYSTDTVGAETYTVFVKNLASGELLPDRIENTAYSLEWAADNKTLFYTVQDEAKRPFKVFRHTLGGGRESDALLYHEKDGRFEVDLSKTKSREYLLMNISSAMTSEVRYLRTDRPEDAFITMEPRQQGIEYGATHHGGFFYIWVNDTGRNFRLVRAPVKDPKKAAWREVIATRPDVMLERVDAFRNHLVITERENGLRTMRVRNIGDGEEHYVSFGEPAYAIFSSENPEFATNILRFNYTSLVTPMSVYDYNMDTRDRDLKKRTEVLGGYDPTQYESERIFATASDGVKVPISLVYRKPLARDGQRPLLLYGYGSYGIPSDATFDSNRLSLLDRGFIYAIAHIRGGGEMGKPWHDAGKMRNKKNTFTDFIACGEHLAKEKYTAADRMAAMGGSAGGLLMGAVVNMRPNLFKAVVAMVPFVDVITTELDPSLPGTVTEWEEWGNPNQKGDYEYIKTYSPYDNVAPRAYPNLLITSGLNDPRVSYWEPAKWTAKLREVKTGKNLLLLKMNMGSGHFGASGRYDRLKEVAFHYAFLLKVIPATP